MTETIDTSGDPVPVASQSRGGYFLLGAFLGAAIGAAIGLLNAPRPGAETREDLARRSAEARQRAQDLSARVSAQVGPLSEEIAGRARELTTKAQPVTGEPPVTIGGDDTPPPVSNLPPGEDLA
jgi:hypothetical protein